MASFTELSEAGLQASSSRFHQFIPPCRTLVFSLWLPSHNYLKWPAALQGQIPLIRTPHRSRVPCHDFLHRVVQSWPTGLQIQTLLIHNPYRTVVFPSGFLHSFVQSLGAWRPRSINSHPLENFRVFRMGSLTDLSMLACRPPGPDFIDFFTEPLCFIYGFLQNYPKLACRPPGPDSTISNHLQNSFVFLIFALAELSRAGLQPSRPRFS